MTGPQVLVKIGRCMRCNQNDRAATWYDWSLSRGQSKQLISLEIHQSILQISSQLSLLLTILMPIFLEVPCRHPLCKHKIQFLERAAFCAWDVKIHDEQHE